MILKSRKSTLAIILLTLMFTLPSLAQLYAASNGDLFRIRPDFYPSSNQASSNITSTMTLTSTVTSISLTTETNTTTVTASFTTTSTYVSTTFLIFGGLQAYNIDPTGAFLIFFASTLIGGILFGHALGFVRRHHTTTYPPAMSQPQPWGTATGLATDIGLKAENEDAAAIDVSRKIGSTVGITYVMVVADGVSGEAEGKVASRLAVDTILSSLRDDQDEGTSALRRAFSEANEAINDYATEHMQGRRTASTAVVTLLRGGKVTVGNVGDSRGYLYRSGRLFQLSKDHTVPQELLAEGKISEAEACNHSEKHALTRALGQRAVQPEINTYELQKGDILLCCTDGLTGALSDQQIAQLVAANPDMQRASETLVQLAKSSGASDNITAALVRVE